jgi:hypothetical protein
MTKLMKKQIFAVLVLIVALAAIPAKADLIVLPGDSDSMDFVLENATNEPLTGFYVAPNGEISNDNCLTSALLTGHSTTLRFSRNSSAGSYDLNFVYRDGPNTSMSNFDLSAIMKIRISMGNGGSHITQIQYRNGKIEQY